MTFEKSQIVMSKSGRDKGRLFIVMDTKPNFVLLADGRLRRVEKPKIKSVKHVQFVAGTGGETADKIINGSPVLNSEIRRQLLNYKGEHSLGER